MAVDDVSKTLSVIHQSTAVVDDDDEGIFLLCGAIQTQTCCILVEFVLLQLLLQDDRKR